MTDEEFEKEVKDLSEMLRILRLIKDKGHRKWLKREIRDSVIKLTKDQKSPSPLIKGKELNPYIMTEAEFKEKHQNNPILSKMEELRESDIMRVLNATYISERFFGKSKSWFSQKLNNHIKNGEPTSFTKDELETLRNALYTISLEIQEIADDLQ